MANPSCEEAVSKQSNAMVSFHQGIQTEKASYLRKFKQIMKKENAFFEGCQKELQRIKVTNLNMSRAVECIKKERDNITNELEELKALNVKQQKDFAEKNSIMNQDMECIEKERDKITEEFNERTALYLKQRKDFAEKNSNMSRYMESIQKERDKITKEFKELKALNVKQQKDFAEKNSNMICGLECIKEERDKITKEFKEQKALNDQQRRDFAEEKSNMSRDLECIKKERDKITKEMEELKALNDQEQKDFAEVIRKMQNMTSVNVDWKPSIGMEFENKEEIWQFWSEYGRRTGFGVKKKYSNKRKKGGVKTSFRYVCGKEGLKKDKKGVQVSKRRAVTRTNCLARIGVSLKKNGKFAIHEFVEEHNHPLQIANHSCEETVSTHNNTFVSLQKEMESKKAACMSKVNELLNMFMDMMKKENAVHQESQNELQRIKVMNLNMSCDMECIKKERDKITKELEEMKALNDQHQKDFAEEKSNMSCDMECIKKERDKITKEFEELKALNDQHQKDFAEQILKNVTQISTLKIAAQKQKNDDKSVSKLVEDLKVQRVQLDARIIQLEKQLKIKELENQELRGKLDVDIDQRQASLDGGLRTAKVRVSQSRLSVANTVVSGLQAVQVAHNGTIGTDQKVKGEGIVGALGCKKSCHVGRKVKTLQEIYQYSSCIQRSLMVDDNVGEVLSRDCRASLFNFRSNKEKKSDLFKRWAHLDKSSTIPCKLTQRLLYEMCKEGKLCKVRVKHGRKYNNIHGVGVL